MCSLHLRGWSWFPRATAQAADVLPAPAGMVPIPRPLMPRTGSAPAPAGWAGHDLAAVLRGRCPRVCGGSWGKTRRRIMYKALTGCRRGLSSWSYSSLLRTASRNAARSRPGVTRRPRWGSGVTHRSGGSLGDGGDPGAVSDRENCCGRTYGNGAGSAGCRLRLAGGDQATRRPCPRGRNRRRARPWEQDGRRPCESGEVRRLPATFNLQRTRGLAASPRSCRRIADLDLDRDTRKRGGPS